MRAKIKDTQPHLNINTLKLKMGEKEKRMSRQEDRPASCIQPQHLGGTLTHSPLIDDCLYYLKQSFSTLA